MNWRPISTAPQNGVAVLLGWEGKPDLTIVGRWGTYHPNAAGLATWRSLFGGQRLINPTHWMTLPAVP